MSVVALWFDPTVVPFHFLQMPFGGKMEAAILADPSDRRFDEEEPVEVKFFISDELPHEGEVNRWVRARASALGQRLEPEVLLLDLGNDFAAYSSKDLVSWRLENPSILPADKRPNGIYFRPKVFTAAALSPLASSTVVFVLHS